MKDAEADGKDRFATAAARCLCRLDEKTLLTEYFTAQNQFDASWQ